MVTSGKHALFLILLFGIIPPLTIGQESNPRIETTLDGTWQVLIDNEATWKNFQVPGTIEDQIDSSFDGISIFRKTINAVSLRADRRLFIHFDAVATAATVFLNGKQIGTHLGGWTPFRFEITAAAAANPNGMWEFKVVCDEKVGHNTQGFLPVFLPHFGGIWQGVRLIETDRLAFDDLKVAAIGRPGTRQIDLNLAFLESERFNDGQWRVDYQVREVGEQRWNPWKSAAVSQNLDKHGLNADENWIVLSPETESDALAIRNWQPESPVLYELKLSLIDRNADSPGAIQDEMTTRIAFRSAGIGGNQLLLNGQPLIVRGLLNWGFAPPSVAPSLNEEFMRREIRFAADRGFNLMKFCLWVPPKRYLDLCDEMGILVWLEYPAWHPAFNQQNKQDLLREFDEFFHYDRVHPSIILRSLTCETGPSADLDVIQSLYNLCKKRIRGAIVEDDSSWIGWNRIHDFYDDHPYGNNHTWADTLLRLRDHIAEREPKPLILGEAIAADTWMDPDGFQNATELPEYLRPRFLENSKDWLKDWQLRHDPGLNSRQLFEDSRKYAMLMRKFQIEKYRQEFPDGGYVVSVIRDVPLCSMGLFDYQGREKFSTEDWAWQRDTMITLKTENDGRSFFKDRPLQFQLVVHHPDVQDPKRNSFRIAVHTANSVKQFHDVAFRDNEVNSEPIACKIDGDLQLQDMISATLEAPSSDAADSAPMATNSWPIWCMEAEEQTLIPTTNTLTVDVLDQLEQGSTVILLAGNPNSNFKTEPHWFLRGAPLVGEVDGTGIDRQMLIELQHFDLSSDVIPDLHKIDNCDHLLALWETHDLDEARVNGLITHFPVGKGHLIVSAIHNSVETSAAGQHLLASMHKGRWMKSTDVQNKNLNRLRMELSQQQHPLPQVWSFSNEFQAGWNETEFLADDGWKQLSIHQHWDSQGFAVLDGWGYYRIQLAIADDWKHEKTFLNFNGVDDYYELSVDGEVVGSGGDLENRITAFDERKSHDISKFVRPGKELTIAVKVFDWQGAGGIFRPVSLTNQPEDDQPRLLR